jgi:ribosomal protein S18 acetylase RimI-like enzyme
MLQTETKGWVKGSALTPAIEAEVEVLAEACRRQEPIELPLHMEPPRPVPGDETNHFVYYEDGQLVGFVSLPPDAEVELLGMVHPRCRRRGIGRALLEAARAECGRRGQAEYLLVCEEASPSGRGFAEAIGGRYRFSEFRMELDPAATQSSAPRPRVLRLERAGERDLEALVSIRTTSFARDEEAARKQMAAWLRSSDQRLYIGRRDGDAVGSLRVFIAGEESMVYLNSFVVRPECRGRGYGREILERTIAELRGGGWQHIRIEVETENRNALGLYRSCGFREIAEYRYYALSV